MFSGHAAEDWRGWVDPGQQRYYGANPGIASGVCAIIPFRSEGAALSWIKRCIQPGTVVNADEAASWDGLNSRYEMKRINHQEAYSDDGACTNWAEEFFSRLRRAEIGHHHHIAGTYLLRYAQESSWREDNRRVANGEQTQRVAHLAMKRGPSVDFSGYWQRHIKATA